ncbi:Glucokinase [Psilocybe cubensis]|uniref:Glucokinase n=1 Tax=Psilocybe cubensis TaxID=181762 RepID=A0ACB8H6S2_PSICU|nr:Glucokinase [Psilocybe cubensis]KAH9482884.1 Glucokinase [Psilocybe cubensis]
MSSIPVHQYDSAQSVFDLLERQFVIGEDTLVELTQAFLEEFKVGLESYNHPMAMIPTFVTAVPDGTETGTFLALDLGGTNLRVCEVVLNGNKTFNLVQQKYRVSETLKSGEATALFDYLADSVDAFLTTHATTDYTSPTEATSGTPLSDVHLGLTFSFPVEQTALGSGKILTWTKGFSAKNAVGNDVVKLLQDAFDRKHMHVKCVALVNDTVGALLSRAYQAGGCFAGAIFGTGTNGAYMEQVSKIKKLAGNPAWDKGGLMAINTEWGAFNNSRSHLPTTPYDNAIDRLSINPKFQAFEKFISGMYLGEVVRNIIVSLVDATPKSLLFGGKSTAFLNKHYGLDTSFMSATEEAWIGDDSSPDAFVHPPLSVEFKREELNAAVLKKLDNIRTIIAKTLGFKLEDVSLNDAAVIRWICSLVARRAALLSGVAVATVLIQTEQATLKGLEKPARGLNQKLGVGVDGSLIEHYPNFGKILRESLVLLVGEEVEQRVEIGLAKDGSGVGAALCALMALKQGAV